MKQHDFPTPQPITIAPPPPEIAFQPIGKQGYVRYVRHFGDDLFPLEAARLSTGNPTGVSEAKDDALRNRLTRDKHDSPSEFGALAIEVQPELFTQAQIFRHRLFSVNAFSGRYSEMPDLFEVPGADEIRSQSTSNHQMSGGLLGGREAHLAHELIASHTSKARAAYEALLALGVAREQARMVLPLNQVTRFRMQGNPRVWLHFFDLRLREDVQPETRRAAEAMARIFAWCFPKTWEVFEEYTLYAERLSRSELSALRDMLDTHLVHPMLSVRGSGRRTGLSDKAIERLAAKLFPEVPHG